MEPSEVQELELSSKWFLRYVYYERPNVDIDKFPVLAASTEGREQLVHLLQTAFEGFTDRDSSPIPPGKPQEILAQATRALGATFLPEQGLGSEEALRRLGQIISDIGIDLSHPRASAHLQPPVISEAVAADTLASMTNASLDTFDSGPASIAIERWVIKSLAHLVGLPASAVGVMTPGGSMSNLLALMCARDQVAAAHGVDARKDGTKVLGDPVVLCSSAAHFSIQRAAAALGLGESAVIQVPTDDHRRMDMAHLRRAIVRLQPTRTIVAVVATAGTTDFGSFDPVKEIRQLCDSYGLWLHVDAAYGFGALFSDLLSPLADGIASANSITLDLHKVGWVPAAASALLMPHEASFKSLERYPEYLYPEDEVAGGYVGTLGMSLQTTRRADALKAAAVLLSCGRGGLGAMVNKCHALAQYAQGCIEAHAELDLVFPVNLTTVGFRYKSSYSDAINAEIRSSLLARGKALIARTMVDNHVCLKLTLLNPNLSYEDIDAILRLIVDEGRQLQDKNGMHMQFAEGVA